MEKEEEEKAPKQDSRLVQSTLESIRFIFALFLFISMLLAYLVLICAYGYVDKFVGVGLHALEPDFRPSIPKFADFSVYECLCYWHQYGYPCYHLRRRIHSVEVAVFMLTMQLMMAGIMLHAPISDVNFAHYAFIAFGTTQLLLALMSLYAAMLNIEAYVSQFYHHDEWNYYELYAHESRSKMLTFVGSLLINTVIGFGATSQLSVILHIFRHPTHVKYTPQTIQEKIRVDGDLDIVAIEAKVDTGLKRKYKKRYRLPKDIKGYNKVTLRGPGQYQKEKEEREKIEKEKEKEKKKKKK